MESDGNGLVRLLDDNAAVRVWGPGRDNLNLFVRLGLRWGIRWFSEISVNIFTF